MTGLILLGFVTFAVGLNLGYLMGHADGIRCHCRPRYQGWPYRRRASHTP